MICYIYKLEIMKLYILKLAGLFAFLSVFLFASCDVDTLEDVENIEQVVSLVQIEDGTITLKADNIIVDKENFMFKKALGLALSGFGDNKGFNADLVLDYDDVPEGCVGLNAGECFLIGTENGTEKITNINVPAGNKSKAFYVGIKREALDANEGKVIAVKLKVRNLDSYKLNSLDSVYITMNTADFGNKKIDVTDKYFLNPTFKRQDGTTTRFANLQDWISNAAVTGSRPEGAGYDQNCGYLGIERWSSGDKAIINGKIYQSFSLIEGKYRLEVNMEKVAPERATHWIVAEGNGLPDDTGVASAIAHTEVTVDYANKLLPVEFNINQKKQVSIGLLINIDQQTQRIIQASKIKLFKLESFFD